MHHTGTSKISAAQSYDINDYFPRHLTAIQSHEPLGAAAASLDFQANMSEFSKNGRAAALAQAGQMGFPHIPVVHTV